MAKAKHSYWKKACAIIISLTFILPHVSWAFDAAVYPSSLLPSPQIQFANKVISIPKKLGTITEGFQGQDKTVVLISDLHCNYEVQKNIAGIIKHIHKTVGANNHSPLLVGEEGAFDTVDLDVLRDFPLENIREAVTDYYVKQGKITGAEYYAATGKKPVTLEGIENPQLYNDSYKMIQSFLNAESQGYVYDLRDSLDALKPKLYNKALLKHDAKTSAYRYGDMMLLKYALYLARAAHRFNIDTGRFSNLSNFVSARQDYFTSEIKPEKLYQEIDDLDKAVREQLYTNQDQKQLDALFGRLDIIEKLLNISVTPEELAQFRKNREAFKVQSFIDFISSVGANNHSPKAAGAQPLPTGTDMTILDTYLTQVDRFYQLADARSDAFVETILSKMEKRNQDIAIMINGGFHTDKVMASLKQKNISYVSIQPTLTRQDIINPYFSILQGKKLPIEKLLEKNQTIFANWIWPEAKPKVFRIDSELKLDSASWALMDQCSVNEKNELLNYFDKHRYVEITKVPDPAALGIHFPDGHILQAKISKQKEPLFIVIGHERLFPRAITKLIKKQKLGLVEPIGKMRLLADLDWKKLRSATQLISQKQPTLGEKFQGWLGQVVDLIDDYFVEQPIAIGPVAKASVVMSRLTTNTVSGGSSTTSKLALPIFSKKSKTDENKPRDVTGSISEQELLNLVSTPGKNLIFSEDISHIRRMVFSQAKDPKQVLYIKIRTPQDLHRYLYDIHQDPITGKIIRKKGQIWDVAKNKGTLILDYADADSSSFEQINSLFDNPARLNGELIDISGLSILGVMRHIRYDFNPSFYGRFSNRLPYQHQGDVAPFRLEEASRENSGNVIDLCEMNRWEDAHRMLIGSMGMLAGEQGSMVDIVPGALTKALLEGKEHITLTGLDRSHDEIALALEEIILRGHVHFNGIDIPLTVHTEGPNGQMRPSKRPFRVLYQKRKLPYHETINSGIEVVNSIPDQKNVWAINDSNYQNLFSNQRIINRQLEEHSGILSYRYGENNDKQIFITSDLPVWVWHRLMQSSWPFKLAVAKQVSIPEQYQEFFKDQSRIDLNTAYSYTANYHGIRSEKVVTIHTRDSGLAARLLAQEHVDDEVEEYHLGSAESLGSWLQKSDVAFTEQNEMIFDIQKGQLIKDLEAGKQVLLKIDSDKDSPNYQDTVNLLAALQLPEPYLVYNGSRINLGDLPGRLIVVTDNTRLKSENMIDLKGHDDISKELYDKTTSFTVDERASIEDVVSALRRTFAKIKISAPYSQTFEWSSARIKKLSKDVEFLIQHGLSRKAAIAKALMMAVESEYADVQEVVVTAYHIIKNKYPEIASVQDADDHKTWEEQYHDYYAFLEQGHLFFRGAPGAGKTYTAEHLAKDYVEHNITNHRKSANPDDYLFQLTMSNMTTIHDLEQSDSAFMQWVNSTDGGVLIIDEGNLPEDGFWNFIEGIKSETPYIRLSSGEKKFLAPHHRLIVTGNQEWIEGRHCHRLFRDHFSTLNLKGPSKERLYKIVRHDYLEFHRFSTLDQDKKDRLAGGIIDQFMFFQKIHPESSLTLRDIQAVVNRIARSEDQADLDTLIYHSWLIYAGSLDAEHHEIVRQSLAVALSKDLDEILKNKISDKNRFNRLLEKISDRGIEVTSEVRILTLKIYELLLDREDRLKHGFNPKCYGKGGMLIEGPPGIGKDILLSRIMEVMLEKPETEFIHFNANPDMVNEAERKVEQADKQGAILGISEMNLIASSIWEGLLNHRYDGHGSPGLLTFGPVNPDTTKGRYIFSSALLNRLLVEKRHDYSFESLLQIANRFLAPDSDANALFIAKFHMWLKAKIKAQGIPGSFLPTTREFMRAIELINDGMHAHLACNKVYGYFYGQEMLGQALDFDAIAKELSDFNPAQAQTEQRPAQTKELIDKAISELSAVKRDMEESVQKEDLQATAGDNMDREQTDSVEADSDHTLTIFKRIAMLFNVFLLGVSARIQQYLNTNKMKDEDTKPNTDKPDVDESDNEPTPEEPEESDPIDQVDQKRPLPGSKGLEAKGENAFGRKIRSSGMNIKSRTRKESIEIGTVNPGCRVYIPMNYYNILERDKYGNIYSEIKGRLPKVIKRIKSFINATLNPYGEVEITQQINYSKTRKGDTILSAFVPQNGALMTDEAGHVEIVLQDNISGHEYTKTAFIVHDVHNVATTFLKIDDANGVKLHRDMSFTFKVRMGQATFSDNQEAYTNELDRAILRKELLVEGDKTLAQVVNSMVPHDEPLDNQLTELMYWMKDAPFEYEQTEDLAGKYEALNAQGYSDVEAYFMLKKGTCDEAATAFFALIKLFYPELPARLVGGYVTKADGKIMSDHTHAWVQVYSEEENNWITYDPVAQKRISTPEKPSMKVQMSTSQAADESRASGISRLLSNVQTRSDNSRTIGGPKSNASQPAIKPSKVSAIGQALRDEKKRAKILTKLALQLFDKLPMDNDTFESLLEQKNVRDALFVTSYRFGDILSEFGTLDLEASLKARKIVRKRTGLDLGYAPAELVFTEKIPVLHFNPIMADIIKRLFDQGFNLYVALENGSMVQAKDYNEFYAMIVEFDETTKEMELWDEEVIEQSESTLLLSSKNRTSFERALSADPNKREMSLPQLQALFEMEYVERMRSDNSWTDQLYDQYSMTFSNAQTEKQYSHIMSALGNDLERAIQDSPGNGYLHILNISRISNRLNRLRSLGEQEDGNNTNHSNIPTGLPLSKKARRLLRTWLELVNVDIDVIHQELREDGKYSIPEGLSFEGFNLSYMNFSGLDFKFALDLNFARTILVGSNFGDNKVALDFQNSFGISTDLTNLDPRRGVNLDGSVYINPLMDMVGFSMNRATIIGVNVDHTQLNYGFNLHIDSKTYIQKRDPNRPFLDSLKQESIFIQTPDKAYEDERKSKAALLDKSPGKVDFYQYSGHDGKIFQDGFKSVDAEHITINGHDFYLYSRASKEISSEYDEQPTIGVGGMMPHLLRSILPDAKKAFRAAHPRGNWAVEQARLTHDLQRRAWIVELHTFGVRFGGIVAVGLGLWAGITNLEQLAMLFIQGVLVGFAAEHWRPVKGELTNTEKNNRMIGTLLAAFVLLVTLETSIGAIAAGLVFLFSHYMLNRITRVMEDRIKPINDLISLEALLGEGAYNEAYFKQNIISEMIYEHRDQIFGPLKGARMEGVLDHVRIQMGWQFKVEEKIENGLTYTVVTIPVFLENLTLNGMPTSGLLEQGLYRLQTFITTNELSRAFNAYALREKSFNTFKDAALVPYLLDQELRLIEQRMSRVHSYLRSPWWLVLLRYSGPLPEESRRLLKIMTLVSRLLSDHPELEETFVDTLWRINRLYTQTPGYKLRFTELGTIKDQPIFAPKRWKSDYLRQYLGLWKSISDQFSPSPHMLRKKIKQQNRLMRIGHMA